MGQTPMTTAILLDLDDCLINTSCFYHEKREQVFAIIQEFAPELTEANLCTEMDRIEHSNILRYGFTKDRFPTSLVELYKTCYMKSLNEDSEKMAKHYYNPFEIADIGWSVYHCNHPYKDGALDTLKALKHNNFSLFCVTKGDLSTQRGKILNLGAEVYFDQIEVVPEKDPSTYREIIRKHKLNAQQCWMVGDSIHSDINPAIAAGLNAVHIPHNRTWSFEMADLHEKAHTLTSITELVPFLLQRMTDPPKSIWTNKVNP